MGLSTFAQTSKKTLNYQAVILDPKAIDIPGASIVGQPLNNGKVCLRFSLLNAQGGLDYEETQQVTTDEYGLVSVNIGVGVQAQAGNSTSIYKSFESMVWNSSVKSLKVSVSYDGCNSFKQVSSQALNYTPYALYAESVDYKNVRDAPTKLSQFSNDAGFLIPKDLDPLKADIISNTSQLATANQTIADNKKSSDAAFLIVNQSVKSLDTKVAENTSSIGTINTKLGDQQNQINDNRNQITATNNNLNTQIGGLQGQLNTTNSTVSNLTGTAEQVSNKSTAINLGGANPSDQAYPSQRATKAYVDNAIYDAVGTGVPDATTLAAGKVKLSGDLGGTAMNPTVPGLANKENSSNKSTSVQTDGGSDTKYPSVKAVKAYVDQATMGTALQATVDGKADKASPALTGIPTAPTAGPNTNTTQIATTAFVQAATAGIALQASVDAKADKNSPTFTGNPILPTGTTGVTQSLGNNSTKLATTAYVDAQVSAGAPDANSSTKGKIQLAGALGGTADSPTVPGLLLKEDLSNKSTATDLGAGSTSDIMYPSQKAVKAYIDAQASSLVIPEATALVKGKLQLAGDLTGSASSPAIATGAINSAKILDQSIATDDIADLAITDVKISGISGGKVSGNIAGNAANVNGTVAVGNGGTGATNLSGYVIGNGTSAMTTVSKIPVADVTGAIKKVNGTLPNASGEVQIFFGRVSTGTYANKPTFSQTNQTNGDIYVVSGDANNSENGRTFIRDDNTWNEVSPNMAATDARYLQLSGGNMGGDVTFPTGKKVILTDAPTGSTDAANKAYVDNKIASDAPNATNIATGKIQLSGDLGGTAISPTVPGLLLKAPINNPAFTGSVTGITSAMVGLGNVDNTSDANKPISIAAQSAIGLKAPLASPTFTGTVSGITKAMVDLANVDNTSDASKPVSTAAQTALNLKENASNKSNDVALGTSSTAFPTQNAVKTYVDAQIVLNAPDADATTKGKVQLAGDLTGLASSPTIATGAITSVKILDGAVATIDLADLAVTDAKISGVAGSKVSGNITGNSANVTGTVAVANGGTGATTVSAALTALGAQASANLSTNMTTDATSTTKYPAVKTIKEYVDGSVSSGAPDATSATPGKIQLAGDLGGTNSSAAVPVISNSAISTAKLADGAVTSAKILNGEITNDDISTTAAIADSKLATIATSGKVSNSATTATNNNTASAIVARDASGNFTAGTITAALTGNASTATKLAASKNINGVAFDGSSDITISATAGTLSGTSLNSTVLSSSLTSVGTLTNLTVTNPIAGSITGNAANVTGTVAVANGGTGATTLSGIIKGNGTNAMTIATAADFPTLNQSTTGNASTATKLAASKNINGVAFDGSSDITISATAGTLSGTTLNSTVLSSSLTSVGTLTNLTVTNPINGSITGNSANVSGTVAVANGGTGATSLSGYVKGNGTSAMSTVSKIPVADVTGAVTKVNGTLPDASGEVQIFFGKVSSGTYANRPTFSQTNQTNGDIYVVSGDGNATQNGRTFIRDDNSWNEVSPNTSATDARYLQLSGGSMGGDVTFPTGKKVILTDAPSGSTDAANKSYVDSKIATEAPNATSIATGKIQLAGDLGGTNSSATVPVISNLAISTAKLAADAVTSAKILDGEITNDDISTTAAIADAKLATITTTGKVSNSATTATNNNTASAIVARDASGNFTAGNITAALTGNASTATKLSASKNINGVAFDGSSDITISAAAGTLSGTSLNSTVVSSSLTSVGTLTNLTVTNPIVGSITGTAANVTGTVAVGNGGTGVTTLSGLVKGNGTSAMTAAIAGTDYQVPISLTTTGSGAASFSGNTLNIPSVSSTVNAGSISGTVAVANGGTGATTLTTGSLLKGNGTSAISAATAGTDYSAGTSTLLTGILKSTTITGALTIATAADFPTLNQSTTGNASTATSATSFSGNLAGDVTGTQSATVVDKINGTSLAGLATGLLKNTTSTGVPTIATAGTDYQAPITLTTTGSGAASFSGNTLNIPSVSSTVNAGSISGTVAVANGGTGATTLTTGSLLKGNGTSAISAATAGTDYSVGTSTLLTGILKSTNITGALTIASASDFPTLNQSTTGNAATATKLAASKNINGTAFDGSSDITISAAAGTLTGTTLNSTVVGSSLTSVGTITSGTWSGTTIAVAKGGTGVTATPTNGQILIGNGTGFTLANLTQGTGITITNASGSISIAAAVRPKTEQFTATAGQTIFDLAETPLNGVVWMFINGVRTNNLGYSLSSKRITYVPGSNGSYALLANDRIQFDYAY